jgi:homeobox even-skipped homolog protein
MKDKRQRIAVAWPYAAVYSDPAFAASILQAAANSVGMPYGYGPNPMMPQMMPQGNHFNYGYRYAPYPIPPRTSMPGSGYPMLNGMSQGYTHLSIPKTNTPPHDLQSQASPQSSLSLSPGSDKSKFDSTCSPIKSLDGTPQGLLMTAPQNQSQTTNLLQTPEKPKLFKPYKSEA